MHGDIITPQTWDVKVFEALLLGVIRCEKKSEGGVFLLYLGNADAVAATILGLVHGLIR